MDITPQEESMIKALRSAELPPLFALIQVRNAILHDTVNVDERRRDDVMKSLDTYIGPLWDDARQARKTTQA
ncbi:hypothetical protein [Paenibacillus whitsoniae]|uniref:Uncharacterized protein n=1 Tax=Paenibacillus whitsoniae TaxID=2496558 RepID=A0A3S0IAI3_9BACL|nr:hypothetical protein [Paenibacillus whitsoniae]RTE08699.1 hypothetical protein EJQ19_16075 [Paenibacillus whitsoniae]